MPEIDALVEQALRARKTPGAVVLVGRSNGVIFRRAYGYREISPRRVEMTLDTIFDLASLTKPLVVASLVQWLVAEGRIDLDDPVAAHLPEFGVRGKSGLTVRQLLLHTSGMPASNPLRNYRHGPERAIESVMRVYPEALPERRIIYSDLGYIVLGKMVERLSGESLDETARRVLWQPLGMNDTDFRPAGEDSVSDILRVAPTEFSGNRKMSPIRGEVQDPRAYRLGGVAGNAGLFSTGDDLARFAMMILREGELVGERVLAAETVRGLAEPVDLPGGHRRTLGWDVSTSYSRARGSRLSDSAFGHGGYTGTSLWIDPARDLFVVFLSNRNHPFGTGSVLPLQGDIADAAVEALFGPPAGDAAG
jgi:CubicO group peptidase (beta-lactamase class C family)